MTISLSKHSHTFEFLPSVALSIVEGSLTTEYIITLSFMYWSLEFFWERSN
jgi:hypothetical protein